MILTAFSIFYVFFKKLTVKNVPHKEDEHLPFAAREAQIILAHSNHARTRAHTHMAYKS